jgi:hypothetical protein
MSLNKRVTSVALTLGTDEQLKQLQEYYKENTTLLISRAIAILHNVTFCFNCYQDKE